MAHVPSACDHCGQVDDHPKWHHGVDTYHHDCAPARLIEAEPKDSLVHEIVRTCHNGTRGHALRKHIVSLHEKG